MTLLPDAEPNPPRFLTHVLVGRPQPVPSISCPEIDYRSWRKWQDVGDATRQMSVVFYGQAWRAEDEVDLAPAAVALAHHQGKLIVYAELSDADIFNPIREHGAHAYPHGDVFEIFLRAEGAPNYFEHHITPGNTTLQLSFPTPTSFAENCTNDPGWSLPFATTIPVPSRVLVQPEIQTWRILAVIPLSRIAPEAVSLPDHWRFSFCRYDHTHGREKPVLSSTTPHPVPNFHHQEKWGHLLLK
jgi:hypothetical protein